MSSRDNVHLPLNLKVISAFWAVLAIALIFTSILISETVGAIVEERTGKHSMNIARVVAHTPAIREFFAGSRDQEEYRALIETLRNVTRLDIYLFDMQGNVFGEKLTHRSRLVDQERDALEGREYVRVIGGDIQFLQAFMPVFSATGTQMGVVMVGNSLEMVDDARQETRGAVWTATFIGLLIGLGGAVMLAHDIKRSLFGLEPYAIAKLLEEHSAILHSVKEGILAIDNTGRITLVNEEATRLLSRAGIEEIRIGQKIAEVVPQLNLDWFLAGNEAVIDVQQRINGVSIVTSRVPIIIHNRVDGAVVTFRDTTEIRRLAEELTGVRDYVEALRSQTHEFMNKLHVVLGLVRMQCYDEVVSFISRITKDQGDEIQFVGHRVKDPVLAGFILGKLSRSRELNVEFALAADSYVASIKDSEMIHELIAIIGNLTDNAFDAVEKAETKEVTLKLYQGENELSITVSDTGTGIPINLWPDIYVHGISTKAPDRGVGLAIVKKSVSVLQGALSFTTEADKGTIFQVTIPLDKSESDKDRTIGKG